MTNDSVKEQISKAIETRATIHGNRRAFQQIRELGIEVQDGSEIVSYEEFVDKIFSDERKAKALERVRKLPELPDIPLPSVTGIYREILQAIILGTNGAAITLSSILVEYMLKFATYKIEMDGFQRYDGAKWDGFERTTFAQAIDRADKNGLLLEDRKQSLIEFKNKTRNPYLHYNIKKITEGVSIDTTRLDLRTGESEVVTLLADSHPIIQPGAKKFVDERNVLEVFNYANDFVKEMWSKIAHLE